MNKANAVDNLGRSPIALPTTSGAQLAVVPNGGLLDVRNEGQSWMKEKAEGGGM